MLYSCMYFSLSPILGVAKKLNDHGNNYKFLKTEHKLCGRSMCALGIHLIKKTAKT